MGTGAPDYFKRILLYGLYEGATIPLACDEQGRLVFISEEVSPFNKAGTMLVRETFDAGLVRVATGGVGTGNSVAVDNSEAVVGSYSCKLTGGSTIDRTATINFYYHPSAFNKLGVEFAVRWGANVSSLYVSWSIYSGDYFYDARMQYLPADDKWQIYDWSTPAWVDVLTGVNYPETAHHFRRFKLTIDLETQVYLALRHPGGPVDLSSYAIRKVASALSPYVISSLRVVSTTGNNGVVYLDNIIFTQDES